MAEPTILTPAQRRFLLSYADEFDATLLPRGDAARAMSPERRRASRKRFVREAAGADFDGLASPAEIRVARNLASKGLLQSVEVHGSATSAVRDGLAVVFSRGGLEALFDLSTNDADMLHARQNLVDAVKTCPRQMGSQALASSGHASVDAAAHSMSLRAAAALRRYAMEIRAGALVSESPDVWDSAQDEADYAECVSLAEWLESYALQQRPGMNLPVHDPAPNTKPSNK